MEFDTEKGNKLILKYILIIQKQVNKLIDESDSTLEGLCAITYVLSSLTAGLINALDKNLEMPKGKAKEFIMNEIINDVNFKLSKKLKEIKYV